MTRLIFVEGEKDADRLADLGIPATTNGSSQLWPAGSSAGGSGGDDA